MCSVITAAVGDSISEPDSKAPNKKHLQLPSNLRKIKNTKNLVKAALVTVRSKACKLTTKLTESGKLFYMH